jgi:hypothetical protein
MIAIDVSDEKLKASFDTAQEIAGHTDDDSDPRKREMRDMLTILGEIESKIHRNKM